MTTMTSNYIGKATSRVDGREKVTGAAKYAGEFHVPNLTYGVVVSSAIAKGRITRIDASDALNLEGVLQVFTHENAPRQAWLDHSYKDDDSVKGSPFRPLYDAEIKFSQQPVALVVAETFEIARYASSLVRVEYEVEQHETDLEAKRHSGYEAPNGKSGYQKPPPPRGDADKAFDNAPVKIRYEYKHGAEHHNPIELFTSTVVVEENDKYIVYDKTQGVCNSQQYINKVFNLKQGQARVLSPYMGGGFGSGLRPQYQLFLAMLAAKALRRSVRVTLTRQQMFSFGHRPATLQTLALGASPDGNLEAVIHEALSETSQFEDYTEVIVNWSGLLYQCDNIRLEHYLTKLDVFTPLDMRAPGAATGVYALECAMDELAYAVGIDPLELRLKNYTERDQNVHNRPFSSKELRECYRQGAERFGWHQRNPAPRSMRKGNVLVGWGMASGVWDAFQKKAAAKAVLSADGKLIVSSAT
ncbi:MAG TPA: xanthine dehydrogenase family protein molybdopterin-binding subunit, partial [Hymenobacter sp.]